MNEMSKNVYAVKSGDTLSSIAKKTGIPLDRLIKLNGIKSPDKITVGQPIYLNEQAAFSCQVLFLDALRYPIEKLCYQIKVDGKNHTGKTSDNGLSLELITRNALSQLEILIKDAYGQWQRLGTVPSDYGKKIVTVVSPYITFKDKTEPHPEGAPTGPQSPQKKQKQHHNDSQKKANQSPTPNNPNLKKRKTKGKHGESVIEINLAIPEALKTAFDSYKDAPIKDEDWERYARDISCEVAVLKSISRVESRGAAFWMLHAEKERHVPVILYERHYFSKETNKAYDKDYKDLSGPPRGKSREPYGNHTQQYLRFIQAYGLAPDAAIASCSWGKFQIMGREWKTCGAKSIQDFFKTMCRGEAGQIELLAGFIENKAGGKLLQAVKKMDWPHIALYYNGSNYKENNYHHKLESAYNEIIKNA